jgi:dipeptidyl aminopeptidase/acylaminoacyl peptidase
MLALGACGQPIPTTANQTPTPSPTGTPTPTPKPGSAFAYAFARDGQVWVAQAGKAAQQLSHLPTTSGQSISALAWSPDGKHLAFEVKGTGSPVDYVIDASSGDFSALNVPATSAAASLGWANNKTVIAIKQVSGKMQFWKTDITNSSASKLTEIDSATQVKIANGFIYYSQLDTNLRQIMVHRFDVAQGSEGTPVAITPPGSSTLKVNWDVAPDGSRVLMGFNLATPDPNWDNGFWNININDSTDRAPIFTNDEISFSTFKGTDTITLSFSSDGQTLLLDTQNSVGPITEGVDDSNFTTYSPHVGITSPLGISWAPNGASFALNSDNDSGQSTIYTVASKSAGSAFVDKASLLQWSPQS